MSRYEQLVFSLSKFVQKLPLKQLGVVLSISFFSAAVAALVASWLFFPKQVDKLPKLSVMVFDQAPPRRKGPTLTKDEISRIIARNIFNKEGKIPDDEIDKETKAGELVKTDLPLAIRGLIYAGDPYSGLVVIEDTSKKKTDSFMVGDYITGGAKLLEIQADRIIFEKDNHREFLEVEKSDVFAGRKARPGGRSQYLDASPSYAVEAPAENFKEEGFERTGTEMVMAKDYRQKLLTTDFAKTLQDAKAEPYMENGELNGFKMVRIKQDSIYQKAGIQNEDIIKEINGVSLTDTAQAIKLLNSLRGESEIEVRLSRGGKLMNLNMQVK